MSRLLTSPCSPFVQAADDVVLVFADRRHVDALQSRLDAERLARGSSRRPRNVQEGLCRDASPMQTGAAEFVLFDQDDALVQLGGTWRAGVPAAAASQNHDVEQVPRTRHSHDRRHGHPCSNAGAGLPLTYRPDVLASWMRCARQRNPFRPLGVNPWGAASLNAGPAMSRCAQDWPCGMNASQEQPGDEHPLNCSPMFFMSAIGDLRLARRSPVEACARTARRLCAAGVADDRPDCRRST